MHLLVSRIALVIGFLALGLAGSTAVMAETTQPTQLTSTRLQRPIADDPSVDHSLVAHVAAPQTPATAQAAQPAAAPAAAQEEEPEYQIASLGPAMRPLHPKFDPQWPTSGVITTYFGEVDPVLSPRGHSGLDIANDTGTPIRAADEGEVLKAYWDNAYGGLIVIAHPSGYETWYGHLSRLGVEKDDHVTRGEQIGSMGSTGFSTGPHLHFEVRQEGELRDPLNYLAESALKPGSQ